MAGTAASCAGGLGGTGKGTALGASVSSGQTTGAGAVGADVATTCWISVALFEVSIGGLFSAVFLIGGARRTDAEGATTGMDCATVGAVEVLLAAAVCFSGSRDMSSGLSAYGAFADV